MKVKLNNGKEFDNISPETVDRLVGCYTTSIEMQKGDFIELLMLSRTNFKLFDTVMLKLDGRIRDDQITILQKAAELLVECEYVLSYKLNAFTGQWVVEHQSGSTLAEHLLFHTVCFDQDTLEGRRQADALKDYLVLKHKDLWLKMSNHQYFRANAPHREWDLEVMKRCIQELIK